MNLERFAYDPADSPEVRMEKVAIFIVAGSCCLAGFAWAGMYALVFGWGLTTALPLCFVAVVGTALLASHRTRNHYYAVYAQIVCIIYVTTLLQWSIGGILDSGMVITWSFCGPIVALVFFDLRRSALWFALAFANLAITIALDNTLVANAPPVAPQTRAAFFFMNLSVSQLVVFLFAGYFVSRAIQERQRAEALLLNILPVEIAPRLKADPTQTIADEHAAASVLFADMVGSTPLFAGMAAHDAVDWLNEVFTAFDRLVDAHGVEKIRTIGDNYMVAAGVPTARADHAEVLCALALDMIAALEATAPRNEQRMVFRFGIHSGPLVAGVIGERKFQYDLWGDTVNTAARMESHGVVGRVQISDATHALVQDAFACEPRGTLAIKGKGEMTTWFVTGPKT